MKLSLFPLVNDLEIQSQNLYGSESSIDCFYGGNNLRSTTGFQTRITEIHNSLLYGPESNVNYDEGRIGEFYFIKCKHSGWGPKLV